MRQQLDDLKIKIYADGADYNGMVDIAKNPLIKGFTTNPSLLRIAGVTDYKKFAKTIIEKFPDYPISFEVFADDFLEMKRQALEISSWGLNVYVKIPITNTKRESSCQLIHDLSYAGVKVNVTAIFLLSQVIDVRDILYYTKTAGVISIFAGRIADAGVDPSYLIKKAKQLTENTPNVEVLWASTREVLNIFQAEDVGCDIITVTNDLLKKLNNVGKDLGEYSLETVKQFARDAHDSNLLI